ncbi:MAG TPA: hypothetical protein DDX39_03335 [Bacteroidales bacterium]|nr:MAG: hypothetical protein A2W98_12985 [Bacteroidetes bacterium GWF2_33_38]OFY76004.1 MAG: hypothetical protein A2265_08080 [Bacteroidetes bacterium RIFOXYA12_FULL_33_9]OFY86090.1 MAG: hypothetical protein A2236_00605 [Bacteroidetes bacterium RIFOXYA2_FULL_33_7]HBF87653.1 hypothetical protein [Bacteroidales bacterium]
MKKILYFVQLPPPIHGVSTINQYVFESKIINEDLEKHFLEIKFSNHISELKQFNIAKIFSFIWLYIKILYTLIRVKPEYVYFSLMPIGKGFYRDFLFVILIKLFRCKLIYHLHNSGIADNSKNKYWKFFYTITFNNSNVIMLSNNLLNSEFKNLKLKNTHFFVVNNGVESIEYIERNKSNDELNILFLSNLFPEKGLFILLNVFKNLHQTNSKIRLNIVGDNYLNEKEKVNNYVHENSLESVVSYHENIYGKDKATFFETADIFAFPSLLECFPLVLLEAMQYKLPIVCFDVGGVSEIVENEKNGFVQPLGNESAFQAKLELLISDVQLRIKLGNAARKTFDSKFTKNIFEREMRKVFVSIGLE